MAAGCSGLELCVLAFESCELGFLFEKKEERKRVSRGNVRRDGG